MSEQPYPDKPLEHRVAERLEKTSTYVDLDQDIVDGLLSDVVRAVVHELFRGGREAEEERSWLMKEAMSRALDEAWGKSQ